MENKYLQVRKENFFTRFVNFFKRIFGRKVIQEIPERLEKLEEKYLKSNFFDEIRINNQENKELLDLQTKYENNEIDLCVMSNEEIHDLNLLYKEQVLDLKKKLEEKKMQLAIMKNSIKSCSGNM